MLLVLALGLGELVGLSACVPFPFASPPLRVTLLGDGNIGHRPSGTLRAAIHPLALLDSSPSRLDLGVGYLVSARWSQPTRLEQGGYLTGSWSIWSDSAGHRRMLALGYADLMAPRAANPETDLGFGCSGGVAFEWVWFVSDGFSTSADDSEANRHTRSTAEEDLEMDPIGEPRRPNVTMIGVATGQAAIGFEVLTGFHKWGRDEVWMVSGGLTFRLPASLGVGFLWLR